MLDAHSGNMRQMAERGRSLAGERNIHAKLTADRVHAIRRRYAEGNATYRVLADEHGVTPQTIHDIVAGRSWKHLTT